MYIEKCFAPNPYILFLELLLTCKSFESKTHPVLRVELLFLLGQEMRRTGMNEKYQKYMQEAHGLFSEHLDEFETRPLSHVIYYFIIELVLFQKRTSPMILKRKSCIRKHWKSVKRRFPIIPKRLLT